MKKICTGILAVAVSVLLLTGCNSRKGPPRNIVEGVIIYQWIDNQGQLNCQYRALGAGNSGLFSGIPPREVGVCPNRAKINMYNDDITWIVKRSKSHIQYNN